MAAPRRPAGAPPAAADLAQHQAQHVGPQLVQLRRVRHGREPRHPAALLHELLVHGPRAQRAARQQVVPARRRGAAARGRGRGRGRGRAGAVAARRVGAAAAAPAGRARRRAARALDIPAGTAPRAWPDLFEPFKDIFL